MKTILKTLLTAVVLFAGAHYAPAQDAETDLSVKKESRAAIRRGVEFLLEEQKENGSWLRNPAITGLACVALHESNLAQEKPEVSAAVQKGRTFILQFVRDNGSIAPESGDYVNYTTSVCLSALAIIDEREDRSVMRAARHFLIDSQLDEDHAKHPTKPGNSFYGGIGYGSRGPTRPDLNNTSYALEALYLTKNLDKETKYAKKSELAWDNAVKFLKEVQNIPEDAGQNWDVSDSKDDNMDGGFVYQPDASKPTSKLRKQGKDVQDLLSYGSMTYAGLKSMIYADLEKDDYRVRAAIQWARDNYDLSENPGMGPEGYYYFLQTFAKALDAYGQDTITTTDGKVHNWREDLLLKLIELQKADGYWANDRHGRWMESIPELVTSYSLIAMEVALSK
ncbi:MAG: cycloartenol synthase [Lentisphaeria bacterium]